MRAAWAVLVGGCVAGFVACSSSGEEESGHTEGTGGGGTSLGTGGAGAIGGFGGGATATDSGLGTGSTPSRTDAACTDITYDAEVTPVNLIFLYDKSGSMGAGDGWDNTATRWTPVKEALLEFLSDPGSAGLQAALKFLPHAGDEVAACTASNYLTPDVALGPLSAGTNIFTMVLENTTPSGGTPTQPALEGTIGYARQVWDQNRDQVSVVVLVTDGEPGLTATMAETCQAVGAATVPNTIAEVVNTAREGYEGVPSVRTHVIGIGLSLTNLNQIALAGSGNQQNATIVSDSDPVATKAAIQAALQGIRESSISCNLRIPEPGPGDPPVDFQAINVDLTTGTGEVELLSYDRSCQNGMGWRYDNETTPSWIELCPARCQAIRGDSGAQLVIQMGCLTRDIY